MVQEQLAFAREFEEERQQEWEEHRAMLRWRARMEERSRLALAAELAAAVVFEGREGELAARQLLMQRDREDEESSSNS